MIANPYVTQKQAAELLCVTTRTIRSYAARGVLPAYRVRGSKVIRYRRSDVDAMLSRIPSATVA